jgi:branched-chain amino acid transport system substrate-binding protein
MTDRKSVGRYSLLLKQVAAAATTIAFLASAAVHSAPPRSTDTAGAPVRIGVSLGLSGTYSAIATLQSKSFRLWEKHVNERGGLLGRPVQMIIHDDTSDPEVAKKIYENFIKTDKVDFVFGPYSSAITGAVAPITEAHGYPMLAPGAASDELWKRGYTHLFGTIPPAGRYTTGFLEILSRARFERIAVVYADDAFSVSLAEGTKRWAGEFGLTLTLFQKIVKGTADLTDAARAAQNSGAQALLVAGHFEESVNMRRALKKIGWTPAAYYASIGPGLDSYLTAVGSDAEGTFSTSIWEAREDLKLPGSAEFLRAFVLAYGEKPSYQAAQAYAAGEILEQAVRKAGSLERAAVREALAQLDTIVLIGRYVVDRTGMQTKRIPLIIQWHKGKREVVWPPEVRTASPLLDKKARNK